MSDTGETLDGIELLSDLSAKERREIEKICSWRRFTAHQQIIDRTSPSRGVYMIVEGRARVVNFALSGREITLDELPAGSYFGELAAIDRQPRSARVVAMADSLIAAMPADYFLSLLAKRPTVTMKVLVHLAKIVRLSNERIMDLSTLGANNRVHAELLRRAENNMDGANKALIAPTPVHGDIASRASTTRETVARVMNELARQSVLERTREALIINDIGRLKELVEEERGE